VSDEHGYPAGCGRCKALEDALREVLDAGEESVTALDDVASMLRFGDAVNAARALLGLK
jgi:hypothetical protein